MACACSQKRANQAKASVTQTPDEAARYKQDITLEPIARQTAAPSDQPRPRQAPKPQVTNTPIVVAEALENNLKSCYLCAKKHIVRAQILFEEYHTGYPDHIKNLIESLRISELTVKHAFLIWQRVMGQLDMAANEFLGNDVNGETMNAEHVKIANEIREERLKLSDNPLYVPNFDELLVKVHTIQHRALDR